MEKIEENLKGNLIRDTWNPEYLFPEEACIFEKLKANTRERGTRAASISRSLLVV